jgi:hypothetical protein
MSQAPRLPQEISPDGREVWDWAGRMSYHVQRLHRSREVWDAIVAGESQCGSCSKWMTGACPREVQDNRRGHTVGPSCKAMKCDQFAMNSYDRKRIDGLRAEYAALTAKD